MQTEKIEARMRQALLQLAHATYSILEREIPESEGLPTEGLAVLRLLRWQGPKTLKAITIFLGVPEDRAREVVNEMVACGAFREREESSASANPTIELAAMGIQIGRTIVDRQRKRAHQALEQLPLEQREAAAGMLEALAFGLVADRTDSGMTCAVCWAYEPSTCAQSPSDSHCAFRKAQRALPDPDLGEGEDEPPACNCLQPAPAGADAVTSVSGSLVDTND